MATAEDLRRLALALPGTTAAPHVDRTAFRAKRIFATLAPDGQSANLLLSPEDQALKCAVHPDAFAPVPGGFGRMGFTTVNLSHVSVDELAAALALAHARGSAKSGTR